MSRTQPQGHRSGEGSSELWNYIREDDRRKEGEPDRRPNEEASQQYSRENEQQQSTNEARR